MSRNTIEKESDSYYVYKDRLKDEKTKLDDLEKKVKSLIKDIKTLKKDLKSTKDPARKDFIQNELDGKIQDLKDCKDDLEEAKSQYENHKGKLSKRENDLIESDPELKGYIEYAKAKKYDEKIEKSKVEIAKNNRVLNILENNPDLKKYAEEYIEKSDEIRSIKDVIKKHQKDNNINLAKATELDKLIPALDKKNDIKSNISKYIDEYNKNNVKTINLDEILSTLDSLSLIKDKDGKVDISAAVNEKNQGLEKNIVKNKTLLSEVVQNLYNNDNIELEGFTNYTVKRAQTISEDDYTNQKKQEFLSEYNKNMGNYPIKYTKWYNKLLHPVKAFKENKAVKQHKMNCSKLYKEQVAAIPENYKTALKEAQDREASKKTIGKNDYLNYKFGDKTNDFIEYIVDRDMIDASKSYDDATKNDDGR